jgi:hypothetical protein
MHGEHPPRMEGKGLKLYVEITQALTSQMRFSKSL